MDGQENRLRVDSAAVRWEDRHCSLKGDMDATPEGIVLDMDLSTDGFRWRTFKKHSAKVRKGLTLRRPGILGCTDYGNHQMHIRLFQLRIVHLEPSVR